MPLNNENNNECCKCTTPEYELILNEQGPQGRQGEKGNEGFSPTVTINTNTDQVYSLTITTADGQIVTPNLKASVPGAGTAGQVLTKNSDTPYDMSFQSLPQAQDNQAGIVQLATETDLEPDSEGEIDSTKAVTPNLLSTYVEQEINNADDKYVTLNTEQQITGKKTFSFNDGIFANSIKEINQGSTIITYNQDASNILIGSTGANTSNITLRTKQDGQLLYQKGTNNSLQIITSEDIATTSKAGIVKPDGTTITIDADGTLHGVESYTLPTATSTTLGGIKVGENLSITEDGTLSGEIPSNMMTVDTNQDVTGQKTFRNGIFVGYEGSSAGYVTFGRNNVTFAKGTAVSIGVINPDTTGDMDLYLGQNVLKWNNINAVITGAFNINGSQVLTLDTLPQATNSVLGGIKANAKQDTDTQEVRIDTTTGLLYTQPGSVPDIIDGGNANTTSVIPQPIDSYSSNDAIVNNGYTTTDVVTVEDVQ